MPRKSPNTSRAEGNPKAGVAVGVVGGARVVVVVADVRATIDAEYADVYRVVGGSSPSIISIYIPTNFSVFIEKTVRTT